MADFNSFKNKMLAQGKVDFDHVFGFQCVDLVREYFYENYGLGNEAGGVASAINYWTNTPAGVLGKFDAVPSSNARAGDVVILRTNGHFDFTPPGHIGIATGNINDANVEILEQNGQDGSGNGLGGNAIRTRWVDRSRVAGLLRPKNPNATTEQVQQAYRDILERDADQGGLDHYVGHYMIDFVRNDLMNSTERHILIANKEAAARAEEAAQQPENYATHYTYSKLETPLDVVTNKLAHKWNLNYDDYKNAQSVQELPINTPFRAFGKAQRNDLGHEIYYMTEEDFNKAPQVAYGVNTVDLKQPDIVVIEDLKQETEKPTEPAPTAEDNTVPVTVIPSDPNKWKQSFNTMAAGTYKAVDNRIIEDAELKLPNIELFKDQVVPIAGAFIIKDGTHYYRTKTGLQNDTWYKIPMDAVDRISLDEDEVSDNDLNDISVDLDKMKSEDDARRKIERSKRKQWFYGIIATIEAYFAHKKNKNNK
jgi:hypothetical protein